MLNSIIPYPVRSYFIFCNKKCRIYAASGVSQTPNINNIREELNKNTKGTDDGNWEEYELVGKLNRNKSVVNKYWRLLSEQLDISELDDVYAIRVTKTIYSQLAERKVLPKADIYLVRAELPRDVLLANNFWIDEDIISSFDTKIIQGSGISCKRPDSHNYSYMKLSIKSFNELFNNKILGAGISLFVIAKELKLNENVVAAWNTSEHELITEWFETLSNKGIEPADMTLRNANVCKLIKQESIRKVENNIKKDPRIADAVFKGKGVFEEPYTAEFIYTRGNMYINSLPDFTITTGSGRHKGSYTIIIKPV